MKTIALFGPLGMLGSAVYRVLQNDFHLVLVVRDPSRLPILEKAYGGVDNHNVVRIDTDALYDDYSKGFAGSAQSETWKKLVDDIGDVDGVINCIGVTNRYSQRQPLNAFFVNSSLPYLLSYTYGLKLLHITTDCVFNGTEGAPYTEEAQPSPTDLYGLSKMLGEPSQSSLVLRTSIIGPEIIGFVSLLEWVKKQENKVIRGFTQHYWNGITTKQFGIIARDIFSKRNKFPEHGLFHIFSTDITKYDMISAMIDKYHITATLTADDTSRLDRRLLTIHPLNSQLCIPSFATMLEALE